MFDKPSDPLPAGAGACKRSQMSGKQKEVVFPSSWVLYLSVENIAYNRLALSTHTEKAGKMMFADIISNSWVEFSYSSPHPTSLSAQNFFICPLLYFSILYPLAVYLSGIVLRI